jgi:AraC family transcriptional regulator
MLRGLESRSLAGHVVHRRTSGRLELSERHFPAGLRLDAHTHAFGFLSYVIDGGISESFGARQETSFRHACRFMPPGERHSNASPAAAHLLQVEIPADFLDSFADLRLSSPCPGELPESSSVAGIRLHREFHAPDGLAGLSIESLVTELLASPERRVNQRSGKGVPNWIRMARDLLNDCVSHDFSLAEIAKSVDVHPVHLCRSFPRYFHCRIGDYLRRQRIKKATVLMRESSASLTEIAVACGFADQSHFCTVFKAQIGVTPGEYRKVFTNGRGIVRLGAPDCGA